VIINTGLTTQEKKYININHREMKYLNYLSYAIITTKLLHVFALKTWKLTNYSTNQGFERGVFVYPEPFWLCLTYVIIYALGLIIMLLYQRFKYGYFVVKSISCFLVIGILSIEYIGYFEHEAHLDRENLFFAFILLIFMTTCKKDLCWKGF
jgi:hypothetical protein